MANPLFDVKITMRGNEINVETAQKEENLFNELGELLKPYNFKVGFGLNQRQMVFTISEFYSTEEIRNEVIELIKRHYPEERIKIECIKAELRLRSEE